MVEAGTLVPGRALDVGCGTGTNALWLAQRGFDVLGVDLSPLAVEKARAKSAGVRGCRFEALDFFADGPTAARSTWCSTAVAFTCSMRRRCARVSPSGWRRCWRRTACG